MTELTKKEADLINPEAMRLINLRNGMLNWRTGELFPHSHQYLSTLRINAIYNRDARCQKLDELFDQLFPPEAVAMIEEFIGLLMVPDTSTEKVFIALGSGGNGKSTFFRLLVALLGGQNVSHVSMHALVNRDRFNVVDIENKLANIGFDLDCQMLERTDEIKKISSGDPLRVEHKFTDAYVVKPFARLVFAANQFPRSNDHSDGFYDRLLFLPFPNRFRGKELQVPDFDQVLLQDPSFLPALAKR